MTIPTNATTNDPRFTTLQWDRPADKVRADADQQYARLRARKDELRPEVLHAGIAKIYASTKAQLEAMRAASGPNQMATIANAKRQLFGIDDITNGMSPAEQAATAMSFRDAQARASQVNTAAEAQQLLDTAHQSGDELLARAVGNRGMAEPGFGDVADAYLAARPDKQTARQALADAQPRLNAATLLEFATPKPSELFNLNDQQIADLASRPAG